MLKDRTPYFSTDRGNAYLGDSLELMRGIGDGTVDLICTSPPFALLRPKGYGNVASSEYVEWFMGFARHFKRILKKNGSLIIDIGGTWIKGHPVRSLYHLELLLRLCKPEAENGGGFHLAQDLYWYNPAKLPTPAEWVTVRRVRVKDAVNTVYWLSPSENPKASNRGVLRPYSESQVALMRNGYKAKLRPSEHQISTKFGTNNGGAIPPNLIIDPELESEVGGCVPVNVISASNTASNDHYLTRCRQEKIVPHPARFPAALPEFAIGLCTDPDDMVFDPFGGSLMTGFVAERMGRNWLSFEFAEGYLKGGRFRFEVLADTVPTPATNGRVENGTAKKRGRSKKTATEPKAAQPGLFDHE